VREKEVARGGMLEEQTQAWKDAVFTIKKQCSRSTGNNATDLGVKSDGFARQYRVVYG
jgi:hypothetical protein